MSLGDGTCSAAVVRSAGQTDVEPTSALVNNIAIYTVSFGLESISVSTAVRLPFACLPMFGLLL